VVPARRGIEIVSGGTGAIRQAEAGKIRLARRPTCSREEKKVSLKGEKLSDFPERLVAYTAEGDPNTGVIIGDDAVMIIDATATPVMAQDVIAASAGHRQADQVRGAHPLPRGARARRLGLQGRGPAGDHRQKPTWDLIVERGQQDMDSEIGRFPRLFHAVESVPA
jgi:hypothetical protein